MPTGDSHSTLFLVSGLGLASFFGAFGVSLGLAKRRSPDAFSLSHSNPAAQLALRALGLGTLCAVLGVGGVALSVKYAFGIHSVSEFGDRIHVMVPETARISNKGHRDKD